MTSRPPWPSSRLRWAGPSAFRSKRCTGLINTMSFSSSGRDTRGLADMPGQTASRAWRLLASGASRLVAPGWARLALISVVGAAGLFLCIVLVYQLALARVPQHRAVLERLVQSQTGLDVRFGELGLRWGWYGPEAVFRRVELSEPGQANVLLRAPQLTVGFDAWRSMR